MSDTVKKYYEMLEDGHIFESPDKVKTIYKSPLGDNPLERELIKQESEVNEDRWLETYANIARNFPDASVRLLKSLTDDEIAVKKVCD